MTSQVTESLAVAATAAAPAKTAAQLTISQAGVEANEKGLATPSDGESGDDGPYYHQHIERNGQRVLVSWTKEEERRVVRKADYLFLPIFAVRTIRYPASFLLNTFFYFNLLIPYKPLA